MVAVTRRLLPSSPSSSSSCPCSSTATIAVHGRGRRVLSPFRRSTRLARGYRLRCSKREVTSTDAGGNPASVTSSASSRGAICNDFVCISSPNVDTTIRQLARDLEDVREGTTGVYAEDATYQDTLYSCRGRAGIRRFRFLTEEIEDPRVVVESIEMDGTSSVSIRHRMRGQMAGGGVEVVFTGTYELNLISGRVMKCKVTWEFENTDLLQQVFFTVARARYSLQILAENLKEKLSAPEDGGEQGYFVDPRNPNKFLQQQDNTFNDAVQFCLILTVMYITVKGLMILLRRRRKTYFLL